MKLLDKAIQEWTASEIVQSIQLNQIKAIEVAQLYVDFIHKKEPEIQAWECFLPEVFLDQATKSNNTEGKLIGVPFGVKDVFNTKDYPTQMGSPIWKDFTAGNNARVVDHLRWEGASIIGKTVTAEFAVHSSGKTLNPVNKKHIVGTSSSGSAAAVASGMAPIALGTQTAGSTIRPSSYCGIFGYKPSFGLIPRTGILKTLDSLDHVCFMAKTVADLNLMLASARVKGSNHPFVNSTLDQVQQEISGATKIGFIKTSTWQDTKGYTRELLNSFVEEFSQEKNIIIEEVHFPDELNDIHQKHRIIYEKALSYYFSDEINNHSESVSSIFLEMTARGSKISTQKYHQGLRNQVDDTKLFDKIMENYDFLLCHSVAGEAPLIMQPEEPPDPCLIWTYLHAPAINIPLFKGPNQMPVGMQLVSSRYNDLQLLDMANYIEVNYCEQDNE